MAKQQLNARISDLTRRQLDELIERWGTTQTETLTVIIDRMYQQETTMTTATHQELARKFGTVTHEGTAYTLAEVATLSNRPFAGWWGDAEDGDEYTSEWVARAIDDAGDEYQVYWQFDAIKGEEPEDDGNWPWDDEHIARVVPQ